MKHPAEQAAPPNEVLLQLAKDELFKHLTKHEQEQFEIALTAEMITGLHYPFQFRQMAVMYPRPLPALEYLDICFSWAKSPQGFEYWDKIMDRIEEERK